MKYWNFIHIGRGNFVYQSNKCYYDYNYQINYGKTVLHMLNKVACIAHITSILPDLTNGGGEKFVTG